jgi:hypothetical protein
MSGAMTEPSPHVRIAVIFLSAAIAAYSGWYHLFNTRKICEDIAAKGWPRFLAKAYSGNLAYWSYKITGVISFAVALFLFGLGVLHIVKEFIPSD